MSNGAPTVQLSIFSGRPDPILELPQNVVDDLVSRLSSSVGQQPARVAEPPGLGYRGFVVTNRGGGAQLPPQTRIYGGAITTVAEGGQEATWADAQGVEQILLQQARDLGYGEIIDQAGGMQANA